MHVYIVVVGNKKNLHIFIALKTDNSLFCNQDILSIHNGYAKKNDILPTIFQLNQSVKIKVSTELNLTSIYR